MSGDSHDRFKVTGRYILYKVTMIPIVTMIPNVTMIPTVTTIPNVTIISDVTMIPNVTMKIHMHEILHSENAHFPTLNVLLIQAKNNDFFPFI